MESFLMQQRKIIGYLLVATTREALVFLNAAKRRVKTIPIMAIERFISPQM